MFFILSKTLGILTVPSHVIALLAAAGLALLCTRFARAGWRVLAAALVLLIVFGVLPVGRTLTSILEDRFPPWAGEGAAPTGVIILGGAIDPGPSIARGAVSINANAERITETAKLARRFPDARIVFTGGSANLFGAGTPESAFMLDLFDSFGIPRSRVTLEERSRNTEENARFTKTVIDPKPGERWLLVTSAVHMPRAVGVFRKAGFPIEAYPVDWRTTGWANWWRPVWPLNGLNWMDYAAKEWVGLLSYRLAGYIPDLLPGPESSTSEPVTPPPATRP